MCDRPCDGTGKDDNVAVEGIGGEVPRDASLVGGNFVEERQVEQRQDYMVI